MISASWDLFHRTMRCLEVGHPRKGRGWAYLSGHKISRMSYNDLSPCVLQSRKLNSLSGKAPFFHWWTGPTFQDQHRWGISFFGYCFFNSSTVKWFDLFLFLFLLRLLFLDTPRHPRCTRNLSWAFRSAGCRAGHDGMECGNPRRATKACWGKGMIMAVLSTMTKELW